MLNLCESCFPKYKDKETLTICSGLLLKCDSCESKIGLHLFRADPRISEAVDDYDEMS
jgi:hypothetical protein